MSSPGFFKQWGNNIAETGHPEMTENRIKNEQNNLDFKIAPLRQQLAADQQRLSTLVDSNGLPKPETKADYDLIESRMAKTIGDIRQAAGDKVPSEHPGRMAETVNGIRQWLKMGGKNKQQLDTAQSTKVNDWRNQNTQMASQASVGALPFEQTEKGQAEAATARNAQSLEKQRSDAALNLEKARAEDRTPKVPKGFKAMEQGGMALGIEDQDTGKQYLPNQLGPTGDAPSQAKQIWSTIQAIQKGKEARLDQKDKEAQERINQSQERLAHALGSQANQGTWTMAEDGEGNPILFNSKTGEQKEAPGGMHKSGYFAKQIAPLDAASMNIKSYVEGGVFDGPGDLALQHEFFTATQPSTGFRMTKVQQDILQGSQSWLNSIQAKTRHLATGTWFSDDQRRQIAKAAQDAIDAKKKTLQVAGSAPKTADIVHKGKQQSGNLQYDPSTGTVH